MMVDIPLNFHWFSIVMYFLQSQCLTRRQRKAKMLALRARLDQNQDGLLCADPCYRRPSRLNLRRADSINADISVVGPHTAAFPVFALRIAAASAAGKGSFHQFTRSPFEGRPALAFPSPFGLSPESTLIARIALRHAWPPAKIRRSGSATSLRLL